MSNMISAVSGFQYSVNIGYDLNSDDKLRNFIPTQSALDLLQDILLSTRHESTDRARVLIGAYGKGKSHIVLTILSLLMKRDRALFEKLIPKIKERPELDHLLSAYYDSNEKLLPVVVMGSSTSLPQAFLLALQRTLVENDLLGIMPETNYKAAVSVIERWKQDYPDVYKQFKREIDLPVGEFCHRLMDFDPNAYETFERIYPKLTAGSVFNPFLGFDVVELYESVIKSLKQKGYTGVYIVYDEFSKYLEANIAQASVSDTRMLQDLAEKCNRSGTEQMHLMLICHKEISNYIDLLPKVKTDGWRGVSERFKHIHLNNSFTQTYEIISSVLQRNEPQWKTFQKIYHSDFSSMEYRYVSHTVFSELDQEGLHRILYDCYPLHPISTFILPRLSEKIAQNERTLFTFLSSEGMATLPAFLKEYQDDHFEVITPDVIYDYFEPLLRKEVYNGPLHNGYILTSCILKLLDRETLESKIVKTISLIYMLEQFEKLQPTKEEIIGIYSTDYPIDEIERAIQALIDKKYVVYLKRSNAFLRLKQASGLDVREQIHNMVEKQKGKISVEQILNDTNFDSCIYPSRYNDEKEMTRYLPFEFIDETKVESDTNWRGKVQYANADGMVYGVVPHHQDSILRLKKQLRYASLSADQCIFVVPNEFVSIESTVREFSAAVSLKEQCENDSVLYEEYDVIVEDLREVILQFISSYTHPEKLKACYIYHGSIRSITRKAALSNLASEICEKTFPMTPIIVTEAINKQRPTGIALNGRNKVIAALLRTEFEPNLGFTGSSMEVSMVRSTLIRTGILVEQNGYLSINLHPEDANIRNMLETIEAFILETRKVGALSFAELYWRLTSAEWKIGIREGLVPIYLAAVFHQYKKEIVIQDEYSQLSLSAETLLQVCARPELFELACIEWDPEREYFVQEMEQIFADYLITEEKANSNYSHVVAAMQRWYMALPKYTKETKRLPDGQNIDKRYAKFIRAVRQPMGTHELLFVKLPEIFGYASFCAGVSENIRAAKQFYDQMIDLLGNQMIQRTKELFFASENQNQLKRMSLASVLKDWCESLDEGVNEQLFADGTDRMIHLFQTATNDEKTLIARIAKMATDLRMEDWRESTMESALDTLRANKKTAESFHSEPTFSKQAVTDGYQLTFVGEDGAAIVKKFQRVEISARAKLLYNSISTTIDGMGQSITEQEKRQVLMEILKKLC